MQGIYFDWTDERTTRLEKLWRDGLSAARIAGEMGQGLTRNAIIGKITRLGLPTRVQMAGAPPPLNAPQKKTARAPTRSHPTVAAQAPATPRPDPATAPIAATITTLVPAPKDGIAITDLTIDSCRWPVDMPDGPMRYCGSTKPRTARAFCIAHARLAYTVQGVRAGIDREPGPAAPSRPSPMRKAG